MEKSRSTKPFSTFAVAILFMYVSGALNKLSFSAIVITDNAPGKLFAAKLVPSNGSTAISNSGPSLLPSISPVYNIGASSRLPSPITISPVIFILFNSCLIESTAA